MRRRGPPCPWMSPSAAAVERVAATEESSSVTRSTREASGRTSTTRPMAAREPSWTPNTGALRVTPCPAPAVTMMLLYQCRGSRSMTSAQSGV